MLHLQLRATARWASLAVLAAGLLASGCGKSKYQYCGRGEACPSGFACDGTWCREATCSEEPCRTGELCINDKCVLAKCASTPCASSQRCVEDGSGEASCVPTSCGGALCPFNFVCDMNLCTDPMCYGLDCEAGSVCAAGQCFPKACNGKDCPDGQACAEGVCTELRCIDASCPAGKACKAGKCAACKDGEPGCTCGGKVCGARESCVAGACVSSLCEAEACRQGETCAAGHCVTPNCASVTCPSGQHCVAGTCESTTCGAQTCGAQEACRGGACIDQLCVGVTCPAGEACAGGTCYSKDCSGLPCPDGMLCDQHQCREEACLGATCPEGTSCSAGQCIDCGGGSCGCQDLTCGEGQLCLAGACRDPFCQGEACGADEYCIDGQCVTVECAGVQCAADQVCNGGLCVPNNCGASTCSMGEVCKDNVCVDAACATKTCGATQVCAGGACYPKDCATMKCAAGQACLAGRCADTRCIGVRCPAGNYCAEGSCRTCAKSESACTDALDEDCDGQIDCGDSDCAAKNCFDGNACSTEATCQAGLCQSTKSRTCDAPPDECHVAVPFASCDSATGACNYPARATGAQCDLANPCSESRCSAAGACVAAATKTNDLPCGTNLVCVNGSCVTSTGRTGCNIAGTPYAAGAVNPNNACQFCAGSNPSAWANLPDGGSCATGICQAGTCKTNGCLIGGSYYANGAANPANPCQVCNTSKHTTDWTLTSGNTCGAGTTCGGTGTCVAGCTIAGKFYPPFAPNPTNPCQECLPGTSTTTWSAAPPGANCAPGKVCSAGACTSGCYIDAKAYAADAANPANGCEKCRPTTSTDDWTKVSGGTCQGGLCVQGYCQLSCSIGGRSYFEGQENPNNKCQTCQPLVSTTSWSPSGEGQTCGTGLKCLSGECGSGCQIDGTKYKTGQAGPEACKVCNPAVSISSWSDAANGTACGTGQICIEGSCVSGCNIGGQFYPVNSLNPNDLCQRCDPAVNPNGWSGCPKRQVCYQNTCMPGCLIRDHWWEAPKYYEHEDLMPGNPCGMCDVNRDTYNWTYHPEGHDCAPGKSCDRSHWCSPGCGILNNPNDPSDGSRTYYAPDERYLYEQCKICKPGVTTREWQYVPQGGVCLRYGWAWWYPLRGVCMGGSTTTCTDGCYIGGYKQPGQASSPCGKCSPGFSDPSVTTWTPTGGQTCGTNQVCDKETLACCPAGQTDC